VANILQSGATFNRNNKPWAQNYNKYPGDLIYVFKQPKNLNAYNALVQGTMDIKIPGNRNTNCQLKQVGWTTNDIFISSQSKLKGLKSKAVGLIFVGHSNR
jgi:hypothetical protein